LSNKYIISSSGTSKLNVNNIAFRDSKGVVKPNIDNSNYTFNGRGWGHGIGMSQYGARQMAAEGFTYKEILKHYYTGVNIQ
jgi:stage II sporulation protein D